MDPPPQPWPTGQVEQLEPLVARVLAPNASPYTYTGTQSYLVGTSDVAVIDPGPDNASHIAALVAAIEGRRVVAIACTHTHRDHSPSAAPLKAVTGAPIIGCAALTFDDAGPRADAAYDADYWPDRVLADGDTISGNGWTLTALATPGHTSNHICLALEETGALFTGDHVMGWSTTVISPPDGNMGDYMASMARLFERDDRLYYPAHGPTVTNPQQLVRSMIGHRKQRERQILRLLGRNIGAIPEMVTAMYKGLDPRLHLAAERSVLAHLEDLRDRGVVLEEEQVWALR